MNIKEFREKHGLKQREVAEICGVTLRAEQKWEQNGDKIPNYVTKILCNWEQSGKNFVMVDVLDESAQLTILPESTPKYAPYSTIGDMEAIPSTERKQTFEEFKVELYEFIKQEHSNLKVDISTLQVELRRMQEQNASLIKLLNDASEDLRTKTALANYQLLLYI